MGRFLLTNAPPSKNAILRERERNAEQSVEPELPITLN